ncbi:hypothetical protein JYU34_003994 [Plutella xylostella]|uniref:Uncharacterized protein n=1 Tax=Plutella xylostella TaxID=51655 RepID=A0ABQ7QWW0_PLUXY|nr:hypothetical protein JYU34_003994 [Plutella xylostella]
MADSQKRPAVSCASNACNCKSSLSSVVLWCCCTLALLAAGGALHRQRGLEGRVDLLEVEQRALRRLVLERRAAAAWAAGAAGAAGDAGAAGSGGLLLRDTRDANDCICPQGQSILGNEGAG